MLISFSFTYAKIEVPKRYFFKDETGNIGKQLKYCSCCRKYDSSCCRKYDRDRHVKKQTIRQEKIKMNFSSVWDQTNHPKEKIPYELFIKDPENLESGYHNTCSDFRDTKKEMYQKRRKVAPYCDREIPSDELETASNLIFQSKVERVAIYVSLFL